MGFGYEYKCSKCGKEYRINHGIGFLFPVIYKETLKSVKDGEYGEEWKNLALSEEYVAVDAVSYIYVCKGCDYWNREMGLSLYVPEDVEKLKKKQYGIKTVEEWGEVPYVTYFEDYRLLKRYIHKCPKCGKRMHKATMKETDSLPCPECGGIPRNDYCRIINWD